MGGHSELTTGFAEALGGTGTFALDLERGVLELSPGARAILPRFEGAPAGARATTAAGTEVVLSVDRLDDWLQLVHPGDRPAVRRLLLSGTDRPEATFERDFELEVRLVSRGDSAPAPAPVSPASELPREAPHRLEGQHQVLAVAGRLSVERGRLVRLVGALADRTERRRLEAALHAAEDRFAGVVSIAGDAIVTVDSAQRIVTFNVGAERTFGWRQAEVLGKPVGLLIPERFRSAHAHHVTAFQRAGDEQTTTRRMGEFRELVGLRRSGEEFPLEASISRVETGSGLLASVVLRDVTERNRAARDERLLAKVSAALNASIDYEKTLELLLGSLVESLADVCFLELESEKAADRRFEVAHRNAALAATVEVLRKAGSEPGQSRLGAEVLESKAPLLLSDVPERYLEAVAASAEHLEALRALKAGSLMALPLMVHGRLLGRLVLVRCLPAEPFQDEDLDLGRELAVRTANAVEHVRLFRRKQEAIKVRDHVLGVVAHDLRGPLNSVLVQAGALQYALEGNERVARAAGVVRRAATRMNRLIQDLLDVARLDAGTLFVQRTAVEVAELLSEVAEPYRSLASEARLELSVQSPEGPCRLWGDRDRLMQLLENLLGNALKFTPAGGKIAVGAAPSGDEVVLSVADTGKGIAADGIPHLFDLYWQAETGDRRGAGLGLPIVKRIVEAHAGRIWVESELGRGTTFYVAIPVAPAAPEKSETPEVRSEPGPAGP